MIAHQRAVDDGVLSDLVAAERRLGKRTSSILDAPFRLRNDPKAAPEGCPFDHWTDAMVGREVRLVHKQTDRMPEALRDKIATSFKQKQAMLFKTKQDSQIKQIFRFAELIRQRAEKLRLSRARIGGDDDDLYEIIYRSCPSDYLSRPQFVTTMRRYFSAGSSVLFSAETEASLNRLFRAFDELGNDSMPWRKMLCMLSWALNPEYSCADQMRVGYALYGSVGLLDVHISGNSVSLGKAVDAVSIESVADFMDTCVEIRLKAVVHAVLEAAWSDFLVKSELAGRVYGFDRLRRTENRRGMMLTSKVFEEFMSHLATNQLLLSVGVPFGRKDRREWLSVIENDYFHPSIVPTLLEQRRHLRNEKELATFAATASLRRKRLYTAIWIAKVRVRKLLRSAFATLLVRRSSERLARFFDVWKSSVVAIIATESIQRIVRGFLGRSRLQLLRKLHHFALSIQSASRQHVARKQFSTFRARRHWAALTIQRCFRGTRARVRVSKLIQHIYDVNARILHKEREKVLAHVRNHAAFAIQRVIRKYVRRRKAYSRFLKAQELRRIEEEMDANVRNAEIARQVYRRDLQQWFVNRKLEYDRNVITNDKTMAERKKILKYRNDTAAAHRSEFERILKTREEKEEEMRVEAWLKHWEEVKKTRGKAKAATCKTALTAPIMPDEVSLQQILLKKIEDHIPDVLKRADQMGVPMEVAEAREISRREVVEIEVQREIETVHNEMIEAAKLHEAKKLRKAEEEEKKRRKEMVRKRDWAAFVIQGAFRIYKARTILRDKAVKRYVKHFDKESCNYYYEDKRTKATQWEKPKALGNYDVSGADGWVLMVASNEDKYYYNPKTWIMQWEVPRGTTMCSVCSTEFAVAKYLDDDNNYCNDCLHKKCMELMKSGIAAADIFLKFFKGNVEKSIYVDFNRIKPESWLSRMVGGGPSAEERIKQRREEERRRREEESAKAAEAKVSEADVTGLYIPEVEMPPANCERCASNKLQRQTPSTKFCTQCGSYFCDECYLRRHKRHPWSMHDTPINLVNNM